MARSLAWLGELRQVRTEQHPRHRRLDGFEGAAIGVARLGVEGVGLARAAGHPEQNARLAAVRVRGRIRRQGLDPAGSRGAQGARGSEPHHLPSSQLRDMAVRATHGDTPFAPGGRESSRVTGQRTLDRGRPGPDRPGQWFRWNSGPFRIAQKMSARAFACSSSVFLRSTNRTRSASSSGLGRRVRVAR